ncbi:neural cell adhesion molecule L1.2 [Chanos chanos]|uniref:Neural cell adhesion molecule L1 n=1 Tax=Chanos chanos TaxID=29144 RepID=A0A6J2UVR3_CHACN|nr:neural cell adhesion molecule L1-like [Chanos chanos]
MPTTSRQQVGGRGWHTPLLLPLLSLLSSLAPRPGQAAIHIPAKYQTHDLKTPPVITAQPQSITAFSVDDISLTCEASGNPPPIFRWVKDGELFEPADYPDLSVTPGSGTFTVRGDDGLINQYEGKYSCYASNELGTAISNEVIIITENTPTLQKEKKVKLKVEEGESVILPCNPPESTVAPVIHWMDQRLRHIELSERVTQGRDGNLYFSHVMVVDSRSDYTCNAQYLNARTILSKEPITLTVPPSNSVVRNRRPRMMRPSNDQSSYLVLRGQNLELECIASGLPTPSIQWVRKDGEMPGSRTTTENHGRLLRFSRISESDGGEYQCTATNTQGTTTHTYTVTVEAAPFWIKEPESQLYAPGETVTLQCQADGTPKPQVTWSINGIPIADIDPDSRRTVQEGTIILKNVSFTDTAVYQCKAANKHGTILVNTYVYVIELPPQILTPDGQTYTAIEGQKAVLECQTFGSPRPTITWERKELAHLMSNPSMKQIGGSLEITNVSHSDGGWYTCSIKNTNISTRAELEVLNRTVIVSPPQHLRVQEGTSATFICKAEVDPKLAPPQIQWRWNGQKLFEAPDGDKYMFEGSTLIVADVQERDEGIYTCQVITSLDATEASGSITIVDRPDSPSKLQVTDPRERAVTLLWTPGDDHNSPVLEYVVEAEETGAETRGWVELQRVPGVLQRADISLRPFMAYRFRVIAVNDVGNSDPSEPTERLSTPAASPDANPEGVRSESVDPDSLVIMWEEMDRLSFNGPDFRYKVMWRKVVGSGPSWNVNFTTSPPFVVTDVGNFTAFDIKVQAVNQIGEGPEPKLIIGYSGEDYPLESPMNVGVSFLNSTAIRVTWTPIDRDTVRGQLLGYKIHLKNYGPKGRHQRQERVRRGRQLVNEVVVETGANEEQKVLRGLQPYSHYSLSVSVFNSKGEGPRSEPLTFETPEGAPGPPASLHLDSPSEKEMTLRWTPPVYPNGRLTGYLLQYQKIDKEGSLLQVHNIDNHTADSHTLKDLDSSSRYRFMLMGRTSAGLGTPIIKEGATTLDGAPPSNISVSAGETLVNLTWASRERHRSISFHIHYLRKNGQGNWRQSEKVNSSQLFYQLQGLQPGTQYHLRLVYNNTTFWDTEIQTNGAVMAARTGFATEGWFIGLISAIVLLLLVLLILCFIKRSKGGKYSVKDKEECQVDSEARPMKDETFGEYRSLDSDIEEKRTASQPSLCEDSKLCSDGGLDDYGNSNSVQTEVIMDESLASQYSSTRDASGTEAQDSYPLNPTTIAPINHGLPNSAAILD